MSGFTDGRQETALFKTPHSIAFNVKDGFLYVADTTNNKIRKVSSEGILKKQELFIVDFFFLFFF